MRPIEGPGNNTGAVTRYENPASVETSKKEVAKPAGKDDPAVAAPKADTFSSGVVVPLNAGPKSINTQLVLGSDDGDAFEAAKPKLQAKAAPAAADTDPAAVTPEVTTETNSVAAEATPVATTDVPKD